MERCVTVDGSEGFNVGHIVQFELRRSVVGVWI